MKKFHVILAAYLLSLPVLSAEDLDPNYLPRDYRIVPPAPGVSQLLDLKDYSVDNYRGIPKISFPIYELKSGAISVPIVLTYQGGGIRATQKCGNAGLGWTISLGAAIGHTVYGAPDDAYCSSKLHGLYHLDSNERQFRQNLMEKLDDYNPTDHSHYNEKLTWLSALGQTYFEGRADLANDIYNLYGLGLSATFAYDDNRNLVISSESPVLIERGGSLPAVDDGGCDAYSFDVTNQAGLTFHFITQDRTRYDYSYGSPYLIQTDDSLYYSSAWHIDKIEDLCGNTVNFHYHKTKTAFHNFRNKYHYHYGSYIYEQEMPSPNSIITSGASIYHPQILDGIFSNGINISIKYKDESSSNRKEPLISEILIKPDDGSERIITFEYTEFKFDSFLISVKEEGETILSFEYNYFDDKSFYLESQDFGGYNNDKDNGADIIPNVGIIGNGANRSVVPDAAQKGVLTKIKYPTGGYTEFVWESNDFQYVNSSECSKITLNDTPKEFVEKDEIRMCLDEKFKKLELKDYIVLNNHSISLDLTQYFLMNPANLYGTDYYHTHELEGEYPSLNPPNYPHLLIINKTSANSKIEKVIFLDKATIEDKGKNLPMPLSLLPGKYDIRLVNPMSVSNCYDFIEANMRYEGSPAGRIYLVKNRYSSIGNEPRELWCGLRIKQIISSTGDENNQPIIKSYYYGLAKDPARSYGTVKTLPQYNHMYYIMHGMLPGMAVGHGVCDVTCVGETAFTNTPLGNMSDIEYPVIYSNLTKKDPYEPDTYLNDVSETFTYSTCQTPAYWDYNHTKFLSCQPVGARMTTSRAHYRGNLLSKVLSNNNGSMKLKTSFSYNIYEKENLANLTTDAFMIADYTRTPGLVPTAFPDYGIGVYNIIPYNKTIAFEEINDENGLTEYKQYEYFYTEYTDRLDYNLKKSTTTTSSEGERQITYYTYPKSQYGRMPLPEVVLTACEDEIISAKRTEYDIETRLPLRTFELTANVENAALLIPTDGKTNSNHLMYIDRLAYEYSYNSFGNLIEIKYRGLPLASYIWGYNGQYPIIEALCTDYKTLYSACLQSGLDERQISGQASCRQDAINALSCQLRKLLSDKEITALAYHPLFGIIEQTDARGISSFFNYDKRGRLIEVRDFNNFLINKYEYHYAE